MDFFKKSVEFVEKCLTDAKMNKRGVHDVVLIGGFFPNSQGAATVARLF
jgi:molecular chaperone DnaK (HSP70)